MGASIDRLGGGVARLRDLLDVLLGTLSNNDVLTYNAVSGKWENRPSTGGLLALDDLSDVDAGSPSTGDIIKYNGISSRWEKYALVIPPTITNLDDLADVIISSAAPGQLLYFNGTDWVNNTDITLSSGILLVNAISFIPQVADPDAINPSIWVNSGDNKVYYENTPLQPEETHERFTVINQGDTVFTLMGSPTTPSKALVMLNGVPLSISAGDLGIIGPVMALNLNNIGYTTEPGDAIEIFWF